MKIKNKLIAAAAALTVAAAGVILPFGNITVTEAVDSNNDDWLHAVGSRLYDSQGNQVWLTGANWFGLNCSENVPHGLYAADCDDFLTGVADKGINIIRFPISTELLVSWMNGTPNPVKSVTATYSPPKDVVGEDGSITKAGTYGDKNRDFVTEDGKTLKTSLEIFDAIMKKLKEHGIKALIDVHSPTAHNSGHSYELWYYNGNNDKSEGMAKMEDGAGAEVTEKMWIDSVTWLAKRYANDDTILAYDLKNEPHGKPNEGKNAAIWNDSKDANNWKYVAETAAAKILAKNPNVLIMIEGTEIYPKNSKGDYSSTDEKDYYFNWWGGNLRAVRDFPIDLGKYQNKLVYSPHDYGPTVYEQPWFKSDYTFDSLMKDCWQDNWFYIHKENKAPLLIGEWGGFMKDPNLKWMTYMRKLIKDNHLNHTFWCFNANSGDTGGLVKDDFRTWDTEKYNFVKEVLWQQDGKFVGLDHAVKLGANGITLSQAKSL